MQECDVMESIWKRVGRGLASCSYQRAVPQGQSDSECTPGRNHVGSKSWRGLPPLVLFLNSHTRYVPKEGSAIGQCTIKVQNAKRTCDAIRAIVDLVGTWGCLASWRLPNIDVLSRRPMSFLFLA